MAHAVRAAEPGDFSTDPRLLRREGARRRRRRDDLWVGLTALVAGMLVLPLGQNSWHGPEMSALLAVSATALLAGQRWAIALIVLAELLLLPTVWPRAFFASGGDLLPRLAALATLAALVPGILSMRRAAAALVVVTGWRRTQATCRRFHFALVLIGVIATSLPLV